MLGAIGGVALLRLIGFASTVFGATMPLGCCRCNIWQRPSQSALGLYVIRRGLILEPPAFIYRLARSADRAHRAAFRHAMSDIMPIFVGTLARYFGLRFLSAVLLVFAGIFVLVTLIDYIELMRRAGDIPNVSAVLVAKTSFYRVPQVVERILPFCVLIGAMSCYLNLSRRLELVVARSAGMSAWQFVTPALVVAFVLGLWPPPSTIRSRRYCRSARSALKLNCLGMCHWRSVEAAAPSGSASGPTKARQSSTPSAAATRASTSTACRYSLSIPKANSSNASRRGRPYWRPASGVLRDARVYALGVLPASNAELPSQDEPDPGTSTRKFCNARNCAVLGTSLSISKLRNTQV